jgi:hypothetical protein
MMTKSGASFDDLDEDACHDRGVGPVGLDEDGAVGAHREGRAELFLRFGRADAADDNFDATLRFLDPQGLLDGNLVEGIHDPLETCLDDAGTLGVHLDRRFVVRHALGGDQNLHAE